MNFGSIGRRLVSVVRAMRPSAGIPRAISLSIAIRPWEAYAPGVPLRRLSGAPLRALRRTYIRCQKGCCPKGAVKK